MVDSRSTSVEAIAQLSALAVEVATPVHLQSANDNEMLVAHPQCSSFVPPPRQELWMPKQEISTKGSELLEDVSLQAGAQQQQIDACSFSKNRKRKRKQAIKKSRLNNLLGLESLRVGEHNLRPPVGKFPPNEVPPAVAALPMTTFSFCILFRLTDYSKDVVSGLGLMQARPETSEAWGKCPLDSCRQGGTHAFSSK
ncbi:uncharacterized protein G2W53_013416 [Senna tora]|uniref:Uncharacterized protein n=1 Tax=Senna tora TaxID=362788 RepID=A0A834TYR0_9FABA|nr:uncharacterized protein G2W53_013416 [Senna tora]